MRGRTALVTGATSGIGRSIAEALASAGAKIALHHIPNAPSVDEACRSLLDNGAPGVRPFSTDLRDPCEISAMMLAIGEWNHLDILVNNAGMQSTGPIDQLSAEFWNDIIAINLSASFHTMRAALPAMAERGYGRVINIASVHGLVASINKAPYVSAKFGLIGLSRVAALEFAGCGTNNSGGVTVNCICPGWTETGLIEPQVNQRAAALGVSRDSAIDDLLAEKQPTRRLSDPSEIGELALWLCGRQAHNITGTAIPVDGGWTSQ